MKIIEALQEAIDIEISFNEEELDKSIEDCVAEAFSKDNPVDAIRPIIRNIHVNTMALAAILGMQDGEGIKLAPPQLKEQTIDKIVTHQMEFMNNMLSSIMSLMQNYYAEQIEETVPDISNRIMVALNNIEQKLDEEFCQAMNSSTLN